MSSYHWFKRRQNALRPESRCSADDACILTRFARPTWRVSSIVQAHSGAASAPSPSPSST